MISKIAIAACLLILLFVNWVMVPRGINEAKIDFDYLLKNCSSLKGADLSDIEYDGWFGGGGDYFTDKGQVATRSAVSDLFCIAYIACLTKPILLPDCNPPA
jgi:hypothetical protein